MTADFTLLSLFCGLGGNALGMLRARSRIGSRFVSTGAFDLDASACADYEMLTGSKASAVDLALLTTSQLRERVPACPDVVFLSAPCKGLSGCLGESLAKTSKYQSLNELGLLGVNLVLEAWWARLDGESTSDWEARRRRPKIILFENVPRIISRGSALLAQIKALLWAAEFEVDQRVHDCGTIGGLAQRRERFLLVARNRKAVGSPLLKPPVLPLRSMADVLWPLPVPTPDSPDGGRLHRLPKLAGINWLRLACVRAGKDWRDLPAEVALEWSSAPVESRLGARKQRQNGGFGVGNIDQPSHTVVGEGSVRNTWSSVADPRSNCTRRDGALGVSAADRPLSTLVIGSAQIHNGPWQVADPRLKYSRDPRRTSHGVADSTKPSNTIIGKGQPSNTVRCVADPRVPERAKRHAGIHGVMDSTEPARTVIGQARNGKGWAAISDGRLFEPTHRLSCSAPLDSRREQWTLARFVLDGSEANVAAKGRPVHMIIAAPDGTVHRPLTTLELAVLQGLPAWHVPGSPTELEIGSDGGQWLDLAGGDDGSKRERIGNAVPVATAQAIGEQVLEVLDAGATETWRLSTSGIWVQPCDTAGNEASPNG